MCRLHAGTIGDLVSRGASWAEAKEASVVSYLAVSNDQSKENRVLAGMAVGFVERWLQSGLPHIFIGEKLAASLCATEVPSDLADQMRLPFYCFGVTVPPGVFGSPVELFVVEGRNEPGIRWLNYGPKWIEFASEPSLGACADMGEIRFDEPVPEAFGTQESLERMQRLIGRLICGIALEMSTTPSSPPRGNGLGSSSREPGSLPKMWRHHLTRAVRTDARDHVRAYLSGTRGPLRLQHIVRGHWQRYHTREGTIWKHKEPYFQGDENAPIAARSYALPEPS